MRPVFRENEIRSELIFLHELEAAQGIVHADFILLSLRDGRASQAPPGGLASI